MLAELEEDMCRQLSRPAPPLCPHWCTEANHDGYDELASPPDGRQMRSHLLDVSPSVSIVVEEYREADDTTHLQQPFIHAEVPGYGQLTPDRARETGEGLLNAASKLAQIGGAA